LFQICRSAMILVRRSAGLMEPSESMIGSIDCEPRIIETQGFGSSPRHVDPLKAALDSKTCGKQNKGACYQLICALVRSTTKCGRNEVVFCLELMNF
jgi:hypothetical protein